MKTAVEKGNAIASAVGDTVLMTTKKMEEMAVGYAVVTVDNKLCGILSSKDILMRVIAENLSPKTTIVESGNMVAVVDVADITHAVVAYVSLYLLLNHYS
ncbi:PREDICTED: CBS [Prunus dulcis]|uniref:PREDICTED: CBS n=1 Tax=Prunus dulcis TaxID=3755 RepID=A0A5E4FGA7_PRUDU|nr:PREDICTED: CBS [Prunus dulcis]